MTVIKLKSNEPVERALRRLKRKMEVEGDLRAMRDRRHYEKPSDKKRKRKKSGTRRTF